MKVGDLQKYLPTSTVGKVTDIRERDWPPPTPRSTSRYPSKSARSTTGAATPSRNSGRRRRRWTSPSSCLPEAD